MIKEKSFFSRQLKKIIFEKGLTQQDLADKLNIARPLISRWITGGRNPSAKSLKKLSLVLNVPVDYFIEFPASGLDDENNIDINKMSKKDIEILLNRKNIKILQLEKEVLKLREALNYSKKENA